MDINWLSLGKQIAAGGATLLGGAIGGPAGIGLGAVVAQALGVKNTPEDISAEIKRNPEALLKLREIESNEAVKLREITASQIIAELNASTESQKTVNETMRAELKANDNYRARWRPTFGYVMAFNMAVISVAFFIAVISILFQPEKSTQIASGFSSMLSSYLTVLTVGLGVLGVQVHSRSKDKQAQAGLVEPGLFAKFKSSMSKST